MDRVKAGGPAVLVALMLGASGLAGCAMDEDRMERRGPEEGYYGEEGIYQPGEGTYQDEYGTPGEPGTEPGTAEPGRNPFDENY
ncbi:MAG: hypothetical protein ACLFWF_07670 [Alphaproteobacteria bacterium]